MLSFNVDLNAKVIGADVRVFLARAGKSGHLFQQVAMTEAIGPDLPNLGVDLRLGLAGDADLEAKIKRSRAISGWLRQSNTARANAPSMNLEDYRVKRRTPGYAQIDGIVKSYFSDLRSGDVLVIPNPSYFGDAIIAEVGPLGDSPTKIPGAGKFEGYFFDGRAFVYFKRVKMAKLPRAVIDLAKAPTGFAEIKDPRVKRRIVELGYDDFVFDTEFFGRIRTNKEDFSSFDGNVLGAFISMVAENVTRLEGEGDQAEIINIVSAAFMQFDRNEFQVKIDINSPGVFTVIDRSVIPLVICSVLSILQAVDFNAAAFADETKVTARNGKGSQAVQLCTDVGRLTESMLRLMTSAEEEFKKTCELLKAAHENTGAKSNVSVEVDR